MNTTFAFTVLITLWVNRPEIPYCYDGDDQWEEHGRKNCRYQSGKRERRKHLISLSLIIRTERMRFLQGRGIDDPVRSLSWNFPCPYAEQQLNILVNRYKQCETREHIQTYLWPSSPPVFADELLLRTPAWSYHTPKNGLDDGSVNPEFFSRLL